jgi:hypothetical protein
MTLECGCVFLLDIEQRGGLVCVARERYVFEGFWG